MRNIFKKIFIPSGEKAGVVAYNSWVVRWRAIYIDEYTKNQYSHRSHPEMEIFPSEQDAHKFAEQLRESQKLLRYTGSGLKVTVEANQNKLATLLKA